MATALANAKAAHAAAVEEHEQYLFKQEMRALEQHETHTKERLASNEKWHRKLKAEQVALKAEHAAAVQELREQHSSVAYRERQGSHADALAQVEETHQAVMEREVATALRRQEQEHAVLVAELKAAHAAVVEGRLRARRCPAGLWESSVFTQGNGSIIACISRVLTLAEVARLVATSRPARDGLRWHRAQLVWPEGKACSLPHALAHLVAEQQVREVCFHKPSARYTSNCDVQDPWLGSIAAHCPGLRALDLTGCEEVTDAGLRHVARCAQLASLNLRSCNKVTDAGLRHVARCAQLASLDLRGCRVTDAGLKHVARCAQLASLNLSDCYQVTDAGLRHVARCAQLASLDLSSCFEVTGAGIAQLKQQSPDCAVTWEPWDDMSTPH